MLIGAWLLASTANAQGALSPEQKILPVVHLSVGAYSVKAEIAENDADRARGLMFRTFLKPDNGMLFVFDRTDQYCFWMRNTKIPLSIAFIDEAGIIANMDEMQPGTLNSHCPVRPVRYALEMNSGWYASKDVKPGTKIDGLPRR
ncbi:Putative lipoprotein [Candidatus Glomeribacter gigasporarum BEG34]|uniref:Putative lipoprotein n=1 Tax=Candidatus Glomeribacter gigasporarum BEG34 TaxID=1070319 RepID=G2J7M3_9BURK|nr:Putative lipoprotein [Candidatus Glomeribacter gigasporarum BEG34]